MHGAKLSICKQTEQAVDEETCINFVSHVELRESEFLIWMALVMSGAIWRNNRSDEAHHDPSGIVECVKWEEEEGPDPPGSVHRPDIPVADGEIPHGARWEKNKNSKNSSLKDSNSLRIWGFKE